MLKEVLPSDSYLYFWCINKRKLKYYRPHLELLFKTEQEVKNFLTYRRKIDPPVELEAFIIRKKDEVPIGLVGLLGIDHFHKKGEIAISLWEDGKRIFFETILVVLKVAFLNFKLEKLVFLIREDDKKFLTFLKKRGVKPEGILKKEAKEYDTGIRYNMVRFGIFPDILNQETFFKLERRIKSGCS